MSGAIARDLIARALASVSAAEAELAKLDAVAGDGDHGAGMVRGLKAAAAAEEREELGPQLQAAGMAFADAAGGASGALVGTLIATIGTTLAGTDGDGPAVHRALRAGVDAVGRLGKAAPGDKTMIDAWEPFVVRFGAQVEAGAGTVAAWRAAVAAAEEGAEATAQMTSRRGRASKLGDRSLGHVDPGARSAVLMIGAVAEGLELACTD